MDGRRPKVRITIRDDDGREITEEALLDTGFEGTVSIPATFVQLDLLRLEKADIDRQRGFILAGTTPADNVTYIGQIQYPNGEWGSCLVETITPYCVVGIDFVREYLVVLQGKKSGRIHIRKDGRLSRLVLEFAKRIPPRRT